ncbi:MAG: PEP-CTERM sorting domain-containing protein [Kiritimatiellae bacterium]|nr:PEP-CTERM sorting domain-containing protein [Kiritimatiellia bacterium]
MKKTAFSFALVGVLAASVGAMQIDWNIDDVDSVLTTAGISSDGSSANWQYVFLTSDGNGKYSDNNGSNAYETGTEDGATWASGTWSDDLARGDTSTYVVALWDGSTVKNGNKVVSVLQNNGSDVTVTAPGTDPSLNPGSYAPAIDASSLAVSGPAKSVTVPEPATAALALAGLALLIRRRK